MAKKTVFLLISIFLSTNIFSQKISNTRDNLLFDNYNSNYVTVDYSDDLENLTLNICHDDEIDNKATILKSFVLDNTATTTFLCLLKKSLEWDKKAIKIKAVFKKDIGSFVTESGKFYTRTTDDNMFANASQDNLEIKLIFEGVKQKSNSYLTRITLKIPRMDSQSSVEITEFDIISQSPKSKTIVFKDSRPEENIILSTKDIQKIISQISNGKKEKIENKKIIDEFV